jgi:acyl-CoA synthetase (NDP forming)
VRQPDLRSLMDAQSVAIVGAIPVRDRPKLASKPITNLQRYGFTGRIYPVNPNFDEISGLPCYPSLSAIPEVVETTMILRRADTVLDTMAEAAALGIPSAIVCSAGFAEAGSDGVELQDALAGLVQSSAIAMCGPNTNGMLNFRSGLVLGFHPLLEIEPRVQSGRISVISHSGTVTGAIMARLLHLDAGFGYVVSVGNEAALQAADYMEYLAMDDETDTVVLYLEQIKDGRRFTAACLALQMAGKSVIALKAGATADSARVAFGHTGALVGSHSAFLAAADRYGIAVAQGLDELVALIDVASRRTAHSKSIVGLSMSGGLNSLMADAANRAGAEFAPLGDDTVRRLKEVVPVSSPTNPFDLTGLAVDRPGTLDKVLDALHEGTDVKDFVFSLGLMPDDTLPDWARVCGDFSRRAGVNVFVYAASGRGITEGYSHFEREGIGVYTAIEPLVRGIVGLSGLADASEHASVTEQVTDPIPPSVPERRKLLERWGLPYVPYAYVVTADEAADAATSMGYPVAIKVAVEAVAHKAAHGLIALGVSSPQEAKAAFSAVESNFDVLRPSLPDVGDFRVEVQKMLPSGGLEVFVGGKVDDAFGPVVSVGLGGGLVEAIADLSSALCPLTAEQATELIQRNSALKRALASGRWDAGLLAGVVAKFSTMLAGLDRVVAEVECNPVVLYREEVWVIDDLWVPRAGC